MSILDNYNITEENLLVVDVDTRDIFIPENELIFGVEGDALSTWKVIEFPKEVASDFDVRTASIKILVINANQDRFEYTNEESIISIIPVNDSYTQVTGGNETKTIVVWNIPLDVCVTAGNVYFSITLTDPDDNRVWSTIVDQGIVLPSIASFSTEIDDVENFEDIEYEVDDIVGDDDGWNNDIYDDTDIEEDYPENDDSYDYGDNEEEIGV